MKLYPHATPDGIIQLVELAELERVKLAAIGLEAECAGLRADVDELTRWQAVAESLATALGKCTTKDWFASDDTGEVIVALDAGKVREALAAYKSAKTVNIPDPLAEAVKRMESVPVEELDTAWRQSPEGFAKGHEAIRARLISAAKGVQP